MGNRQYSIPFFTSWRLLHNYVHINTLSFFIKAIFSSRRDSHKLQNSRKLMSCVYIFLFNSKLIVFCIFFRLQNITNWLNKKTGKLVKKKFMVTYKFSHLSFRKPFFFVYFPSPKYHKLIKTAKFSGKIHIFFLPVNFETHFFRFQKYHK